MGMHAAFHWPAPESDFPSSQKGFHQSYRHLDLRQVEKPRPAAPSLWLLTKIIIVRGISKITHINNLILPQDCASATNARHSLFSGKDPARRNCHINWSASSLALAVAPSNILGALGTLFSIRTLTGDQANRTQHSRGVIITSSLPSDLLHLTTARLLCCTSIYILVHQESAAYSRDSLTLVSPLPAHDYIIHLHRLAFTPPKSDQRAAAHSPVDRCRALERWWEVEVRARHTTGCCGNEARKSRSQRYQMGGGTRGLHFQPWQRRRCNSQRRKLHTDIDISRAFVDSRLSS